MRKKNSLFSKGDVIRTNPENGFYGIAVVLNCPEKIEISPGKWSYPMCHIAITPLIFRHEVEIAELHLNELKPLIFSRNVQRKDGVIIPWKTETCIYVYTDRNKANLSIIGTIDPSGIYDGQLIFEPQQDRFYFYGDAEPDLGREAYLAWLLQNEEIS